MIAMLLAALLAAPAATGPDAEADAVLKLVGKRAPRSDARERAEADAVLELLRKPSRRAQKTAPALDVKVRARTVEPRPAIREPRPAIVEARPAIVEARPAVEARSAIVDAPATPRPVELPPAQPARAAQPVALASAATPATFRLSSPLDPPASARSEPAAPARGRFDFDLLGGGGGAPARAGGAPAKSAFDFDLLGGGGGGGAPPDAVNEPSEPIYRRRWLLTMHQTAGIGLVTLMAATMVTGQLNYSDKFGGTATNRYASAHSILAGSTVGVFAGTGLLAALAPNPFEKSSGGGIDRITVHKIGMIGAAAGMAAQAALGIWAGNRSGYADESKLATVHLGIGYATLALMGMGVGALVF